MGGRNPKAECPFLAGPKLKAYIIHNVKDKCPYSPEHVSRANPYHKMSLSKKIAHVHPGEDPVRGDSACENLPCVD